MSTTPDSSVGPWGRTAALELSCDLATAPGLAEPLQRQLATSADPEVRRSLASNPDVSASVQCVLVKDKYTYVRSALARNRAALPSIQRELARDERHSVLLALVANATSEALGALPLALLQRFGSGREVVTDRLLDLDPEVLAGLLPDWTGSLDDLVEVATSFAPAPRR